MQVPLAISIYIYTYIPRYDLSHKSSKLSFSTLQKSSCVLVAGPICFVLNHLIAIYLNVSNQIGDAKKQQPLTFPPSIHFDRWKPSLWLAFCLNPPPSVPSKIGTITPRFALRNLRLSQDTQDTWDEHILGLRYFDTSLLFNLLLGL